MRFVLLSIGMSAGVGAFAADTAIPDELKSWQGWVLHGEEFRRCPFFANHAPNTAADHVCAWPERLVVGAVARWRVYAALAGVAEAWVTLPAIESIGRATCG
jgi:hypothetical protein